MKNKDLCGFLTAGIMAIGLASGLLNRGVTPHVCQKGSVGACGDLSPMSQIALLLMGEGEAYYKGDSESH